MINLLLEEGASLVAINHEDKMPVDVAFDNDIRHVLKQRMLEAGGPSLWNVDHDHKEWKAWVQGSPFSMACWSDF